MRGISPVTFEERVMIREMGMGDDKGNFDEGGKKNVDKTNK